MNVEFVRDCLMRAFLVPSGSPGSKVDNVKETRKSASLVMHKPHRLIELEDRSIQVPVEPVHASESMRYKGGKIPVLPTVFEDIAWIRAVRESAPVYSSWIKYCYSDDLNWSGQFQLCQYIWDAFWPESLRQGVIPKKETEARLKSLVWLSVQTAKNLVNRDKPLLTDGQLAELLHIHKSVFSRAVKLHWDRMVQHCLRLDYEALANADRRHRSREQH